MELLKELDEFKTVILDFKQKFGALTLPAGIDENALQELERQVNQIKKDCGAYVLSAVSDDIGRELSQLVTHENLFNIPGNKAIAQRVKILQSRIYNLQHSLDYLLGIIDASDPLTEGRSFAAERSSWTVDQKQSFLLLKLYDLRKTGLLWDTGLLFSFNQVALDDRSEALEITMGLEQTDYVEAIGIPGGTSAKITTPGKSYVEQYLLPVKENKAAPDDSILDIFISHSSKDAGTAGLLVSLIASALNLSSKRIRCTSLAGYGFSGGTDVDDQLRKEVHGCKVLIGLLSENSIRSAYVLFELGARWGASKPLVPLLIDLKSKSMLEGPLKGIHAIEAYEAPKLEQLVLELAVQLNLEAEPHVIYADKVKALAEHANH